MSTQAMFLGFVATLIIAARIFLYRRRRPPVRSHPDATAGFRDPSRPWRDRRDDG